MAVAGELNTRQWQDKEGQNRSSIELVVSEVHFTEGKKDDQKAPEPFGNFAPMDEADEDMPF